MLSRPKPGESEVDLLRFQSQFLAAGAAPAVQLVKNGRRGANANLDQPRLQDQQDVVMLGSEWLCVCEAEEERVQHKGLLPLPVMAGFYP